MYKERLTGKRLMFIGWLEASGKSFEIKRKKEKNEEEERKKK